MATIKDIVDRTSVKLLAGEERTSNKVTGGYVGDLLSCVMARASTGFVWVTVQGHPNVVAVATLVGAAGIVVAEGARIDPATIEKAKEERIPLMSSQKTSYGVVVDLVGLGINES